MKRPCKHPGCPALLNHSGYCERHAQEPRQARRDYETYRRKLDPELKRSQELRATVRWRQIRKIKLEMNPLCEDPLGLHPHKSVTAAQVHHVKPLVTHPELAYAIDNLMSVCHGCHAKVEKQTSRVRSDDEEGPGERGFIAI